MTMPAASSLTTEEIVEISKESDVALLQTRVRALADELGFPPTVQSQIQVAASEAATNILKFAHRGRIILRTNMGDEVYLEFEAADHGSGIPDLKLAFKDGHSEGCDLTQADYNPSRRGLGFGLGAMKRMLDEMLIYTGDEQGTRIIGRKYLLRSQQKLKSGGGKHER